ncbi:hypothetical protein [Microbacterium hominis]|uniref:hypothetical protein n=1 Tax=Microbacterium hominis TaxID=162426 RepID=UPI0020B7A0FF|nr:hypothetical protein [Microbacterium hominis]
MEPFFDFLGSYWWLAFPAFGLLAAAGNAWERGARRRHKQRLEVMHAKAELKAAQAAARGKPVPAASLPTITGATATSSAAKAMDAAKPAPDAVQAELQKLMATHDDIAARWLEYELDVAKVIAFPAMSDGRQPLTAAFLRAKRVADGLRPASPKAKLAPEQLAAYRAAVTDFDVAFDLAERDARRIRDSEFSAGERKRLDTAKQLLTVAVDQAATPAERQIAYRRVREELNGLIALSDDAIEGLEKKVMLEIATPPPVQHDRPERPERHDRSERPE